jgi:hypothetical protein
MSMLDLASCRPVRQWSMGMLREHHAKALSQTSLDRLLRWIRSEDAELARFGAELFSQSNLLGSVQPKTWLQLIHQANPDVLDIVCRLVMKTLTADNVSLREAMELACSRSVPLAELGMAWLESMQPHSDQDFQDLLLSLDAESEHIRPKLVDQVRRKLDRVASKRSQWILEYLDSRFPDVRDVGWTWLQERTEVARDYHLWQRLIETPYDDLRLKVIELLQYESIPTHSKAGQSMLIDAKRLSPEGIRFLWATALLNIHRGGKQKPGVVKAMIGRLHAHREEANDLLPILAVALRSIRTTEWQAGLAGIVTWIEKNPDVSDMVQAHFPELNLI